MTLDFIIPFIFGFCAGAGVHGLLMWRLLRHRRETALNDFGRRHGAQGEPATGFAWLFPKRNTAVHQFSITGAPAPANKQPKKQ
jgi:hypothetical protein